MKKGRLSNPVRYHLRMNLTPEYHREEEKALWRVIRAGTIDEVMFFVPHAEERSPGLGTDTECRDMAKILAPLFARLRKAGIAPSINIWWTVAFSDFPALPRTMRDRFHFRWAVNADGQESRAAACPQDSAWRARIRRMYRTYAALKPVRLWIDDDVRMTLRADMQCACFCDECLAEMARRTGRAFDRRELLKAILADPPNSVRDAWLEFQRQLELDVVRGLAQAVHEVSPETSVSLMYSPLEIHWAEGRRWGELTEALGRPAPLSRPNIGPYNDDKAPAVAQGLNTARLAAAALPPGTGHAPEIENYPHSRFAKSARLAQLDMVFGQLFGMSNVTFSIYRFGGRLDLEIQRETIWADMLGRIRPRLQAIADLGIAAGQARGVSLYFHEDVCRHVRGASGQPRPIFLFRERPWDTTLPLMGFATRYGTGPVTAFCGEQICCLSEAERNRVFAGGTLLDARAAECLVRMGAGDLAGLRARNADAGAVIESIEDGKFGDFSGDPINLRWEGAAWQFELLKGAKVISKLRNYEGAEVGHGVICFENRLGGRTATYPYDGQARGACNLGVAVQPLASPSFLCWPRQAQMKAVFEWLGPNPPPLFVPGAPSVYPLLIEQENRLIATVANLSADPVEDLTLRLAQPTFTVRRVRRLTEKGIWQTCQAAIGGPQKGALTIRTGIALNYLDIAVLIIE